MSFDMPPDDESAIEYEYAKEVAALKQQRNELLAALENIVSHFSDVMLKLADENGIVFENGVDGIPTIKAARAAIAKVEAYR